MGIISVILFLLPLALAVAPGQAPPNTPICSPNYNGYFAFTTIYPSQKLKQRSNEAGAITLTMTLKNGILMDSLGRTGYIASNYQFQFDLDNGQAGTIYNAGFSICPNQTIALQSAMWWGCLSGTYRNIYSRTLGSQCEPMFMKAFPVAHPSTTNLAGTLAASTTSSAARITSALTSALTRVPPLESITPIPSGMTSTLPIGSNTTITTPTPTPTVSPTSPPPSPKPTTNSSARLIAGCLLCFVIGGIFLFTLSI